MPRLFQEGIVSWLLELATTWLVDISRLIIAELLISIGVSINSGSASDSLGEADGEMEVLPEGEGDVLLAVDGEVEEDGETEGDSLPAEGEADGD